ncbi:MAG: hypothetical protein QM765_15445 [Myxococcales bacterium]
MAGGLERQRGVHEDQVAVGHPQRQQQPLGRLDHRDGARRRAVLRVGLEHHLDLVGVDADDLRLGVLVDELLHHQVERPRLVRRRAQRLGDVRQRNGGRLDEPLELAALGRRLAGPGGQGELSVEPDADGHRRLARRHRHDQLLDPIGRAGQGQRRSAGPVDLQEDALAVSGADRDQRARGQRRAAEGHGPAGDAVEAARIVDEQVEQRGGDDHRLRAVEQPHRLVPEADVGDGAPHDRMTVAERDEASAFARAALPLGVGDGEGPRELQQRGDGDVHHRRGRVDGARGQAAGEGHLVERGSVALVEVLADDLDDVVAVRCRRVEAGDARRRPRGEPEVTAARDRRGEAKEEDQERKT